MRMLSHKRIRVAISDLFTKKYPPKSEKWYYRDQDERREKMHDLFIFPPEIESREDDMHASKIDHLQKQSPRLPHTNEEYQCEHDTDPSWKHGKYDSENTEGETDDCQRDPHPEGKCREFLVPWVIMDFLK